MIYTVTLNPSIDCVMTVGKIVPGATNRAAEQILRFAGKGINVSRALARLGVPSTALGFAAGFTGEAIAASLTETAITPDFTVLRGGVSRINVKLRGEAETEINAPGPTVTPGEAAAFLDRIARLAKGDTLILSGSLPRGLASDFYAQILDAVRNRDVRSVVDTAGEALAACLPYRPFLIKPNRQEIEELYGDGADPTACAITLRDAGARNVLISLGAEGAILADETGKVRFAPAIPCESVCSVGAGDAMIAGFLAGYDKTHDWDAALKSALEEARRICLGE